MAKYIDNNGFAHFLGKLKTLLDGKVNTESGKGLSTNDYTTAEKNKLEGIAANANNYSLPTAGADTKGGVKIGAGLTMTGEVLSADVQSVSVMTGATSSAAGTAGTVPAPAAGDQAKYLQGDGTWDTPAARHGTGMNSVAEGANSSATSTAAHAEGVNTNANGDAAHSEGSGTTSSGAMAHAEGNVTTSSGYAAHAEGNNTTANHKAQHVFGEWNTPDDSSAAATARGNYVEIVGNGTGSNAKSNARTLDWSGNEVLAGTLTTGGDITVPSGSKFNGSGAGLTSLNGSNISSGTVAEARIANLSASKITSGTFDAARIPDLSGTYALKSDITSMYKHKGSVSAVANLPSSGQTAGDVYNVTSTGMNYVWTGSEWDALGEIFTIDAMTTTEIDAAFTAAGLAAA